MAYAQLGLPAAYMASAQLGRPAHEEDPQTINPQATTLEKQAGPVLTYPSFERVSVLTARRCRRKYSTHTKALATPQRPQLMDSPAIRPSRPFERTHPPHRTDDSMHAT